MTQTCHTAQKLWEDQALNQFACVYLGLDMCVCVCVRVWLILAKWPLLESLVPISCRPDLVPSGHNVKFLLVNESPSPQIPPQPLPLCPSGPRACCKSAVLNTRPKHVKLLRLLSRGFEPITGPLTTTKNLYSLLKASHPLTLTWSNANTCSP